MNDEGKNGVVIVIERNGNHWVGKVAEDSESEKLELEEAALLSFSEIHGRTAMQFAPLSPVIQISRGKPFAKRVPLSRAAVFMVLDGDDVPREVLSAYIEATSGIKLPGTALLGPRGH